MGFIYYQDMGLWQRCRGNFCEGHEIEMFMWRFTECTSPEWNLSIWYDDVTGSIFLGGNASDRFHQNGTDVHTGRETEYATCDRIEEGHLLGTQNVTNTDNTRCDKNDVGPTCGLVE
jgi:hypothetical protein